MIIDLIDKLSDQAKKEIIQLQNQVAAYTKEENVYKEQIKESQTQLESIHKERIEWAEDKQRLEDFIKNLGHQVETAEKTAESAEKAAEQAEHQIQELGGAMQKAHDAAEAAETLASKAKSLEESLQGYKRSMSIISDLVPTEKEGVEVLIVLSERENLSVAELVNKTKIASVVLKKNILPRLRDRGFISWKDDILNLIV